MTPPIESRPPIVHASDHHLGIVLGAAALLAVGSVYAQVARSDCLGVFFATASPELMFPNPPPSSTTILCTPVYTQCDFIHDKITVEAQYALHHLYKQGGEKCGVALSMFGAAHKGEITGIYKEDQGKPALMAKRKGTVWWELVPGGEGAIVSELEAPPMVIFENRVAKDRTVLAKELEEAWNASRFRNRKITPPSPKGTPCAPGPKPEVTDEPPIIVPPQTGCQFP